MAEPLSPGERIAWSEAPPSLDHAFVPIISPRPGATVTVVIAGSKVHGLFTHFVNGRTQPCTKAGGHCVGCAARVSRRWKGYLGCWLPSQHRMGILELTADCVRHCPGLLDGRFKLRGQLFKLFRKGPSRNSPVRGEFGGGGQYDCGGPEWDEVPHLMRVWGKEPDQTDRWEAGQSELFEEGKEE